MEQDGEPEGVRSPSQNSHQTQASAGGESAPLIRARSVVRVHQGPPFQAGRSHPRSVH
jgi:hypothetical protein